MRPERRHVALPMRLGRAHVEYQPLGVVGIVAPWNYPFSLALMPLATALAAGNRAMIKPSEFTPATSDVLAALIAETFSEDEVAVVTGDASVGAAFAALPFDHLFFTGSTAVGRAVMRAASEHLVPVTLELGGKSPVLVDRGQPLDRVAAAIAYGKLANAGQTCIAPDYVLLPEGDVDAFVEAWGKAVAALYPEGPASEDYTSIVNVRHYDRLRGLLDDAQAKGARVVETGPSPERAKSRAHTIAPDAGPRRPRRHADHAGGDLRARAADRDVSRPGRSDRLRERAPAAARALLLRIIRGEPHTGADANDLGRRHHQRHAPALRPGGPPVRWRRAERLRRLPRHRRVPQRSATRRRCSSQGGGMAAHCCGLPSAGSPT